MQVLNLDLSEKRLNQPINAKQLEVGRKFAAILTDNAVPYVPEESSVFTVWYKSENSGSGNYSQIDGRDAVVLENNVAVVELIPQMLINAGTVELCLVLNSADGQQIGFWNINCIVEEIPGTGSDEATEYYTALSETAGKAIAAAERAEASAETVIEEIAKRTQLKPEFANSIEECTDTTKLYVLPDGYIYAYMKTTIPGGEPLFTNALDEVGVNLNYRWSHSAKKLTESVGYITTDPIPVTADQTVYINLVDKMLANTDSGKQYFTSNYSRVTYYDTSDAYVSGELDRALYKKVVLTANAEKGYTSFVVGYTMTTAGDSSSNARMAGADDIAYMRLVIAMNVEAGGVGTTVTEDDIANLIISVGNPIEYSGESEGYAWASTGHAFVPADYEDRIINLEDRTLRHTAEISALQKAVESGGSDETEAAALERIKVWDKPVYDSAPVTLIADGAEKPALTESDRTVDAIYAKYRALMAAHPDYITETNMGKSSASDTFTAVDMLRFDFCEPGGLTQPDLTDSARHETKPTLIFLSGIHTEWVGVWGLYYALEEITTNPDFDDIRRNAHIVVIPCANPCCLAWETAIDGWRMSHVNANGVAIHNNFGVNHSTSGTVGEYNYGGSAPYSEPETQYIDAVMAEFPDAVAFVSCHNNDYSTYYGSHVIWASSATYHMCNIAFRLVDKLSKAWIDKYGQTLKDSIDEYKINMDANDYRLGRATMSTSKGTEQKNATKYGIQGVNLEISRMMKVFSGNTDGTSEVMTHGAEVYANFMRTLLASYDHKDKDEYAPNLPWRE